ncbi:MAG: hypothetical protein B1H08_00730 [Candidatus Omnitrophica bacterium 4484_171]|nr:MAG: hypothetical protein B1H08_00730 [Candidatus Omnitrophica bacterium 4484_171]
MTYILWIVLKKDVCINVGSLGKIFFKNGAYLYIGSAKRAYKARIKRHLSARKKIFWHIDYFLSRRYNRIKEIWLSQKIAECAAAGAFYNKGYDFIDKFGSSDCSCRSHLFFTKRNLYSLKKELISLGFNNEDKNNFR